MYSLYPLDVQTCQEVFSIKLTDLLCCHSWWKSSKKFFFDVLPPCFFNMRALFTKSSFWILSSLPLIRTSFMYGFFYLICTEGPRITRILGLQKLLYVISLWGELDENLKNSNSNFNVFIQHNEAASHLQGFLSDI